ncbi:suppressor of fused domain protein [Sphaerisporangium siamense]|nr:suppressor of fused domain protein [Sphaerisporangium siamense]
MSSPASPSNRAIARRTAEAFGSRPRVHRYHDDQGRGFVDIAAAQDVPHAGVTSYATLGLSGAPMEMPDGGECPLRIELLGACKSSFESFANALAASAIRIISTRKFCAPGVIFPDILTTPGEAGDMKNFVFLSPFLWDDPFEAMELDDKKVAWLLAVPISDAELQYALDRGVPELESILEANSIDMFDLNRSSVL